MQWLINKTNRYRILEKIVSSPFAIKISRDFESYIQNDKCMSQFRVCVYRFVVFVVAI